MVGHFYCIIFFGIVLSLGEGETHGGGEGECDLREGGGGVDPGVGTPVGGGQGAPKT